MQFFIRCYKDTNILFRNSPCFNLKGDFFMSKNCLSRGHFKEALKIRKMSVRDLCVMAMLVAITFALSYISGFLRIGDAIKFNISFISVYVGAAMFGPVAGGVIAAMADVISFISNPTGAFVPIFTVMEFINGAFFGLFLYRSANAKHSVTAVFVLVLVCAILQFCVNMFWRTYELARLYYGVDKFWGLFVSRLPGNIVMVVCKVAVVMLMEPYMHRFGKLIKGAK